MPTSDTDPVGRTTIRRAFACALLIASVGSLSVPMSLLRPLHARAEVFTLFLLLAALPPLTLWGYLTGHRLFQHSPWRIFSVALMASSLALSGFVLWQWLRIDRLLWARYNPADPTVAVAVGVVTALAAAVASFRYVGRPTKRPLAMAAVVVISASLAVSTFNAIHFMPRFFEGNHSLSALRRYRADDMAGREAPGFTLRSVAGDMVALENLRGRVVVVDFWATWCGPCVQALPHLNALSEQFNRDHVVVVALSLDHDTAAVRPFVERSRFSFTTLYQDTAIASAYRVEVIPTTFVVDQSGIVRSVHVGFRAESSADELRSEIVRLLDDE